MKGEERREEILKSAKIVFARLGYRHANIGAICAEAGIARGTLYQYFKNKNDLFRALLESYLLRIQQFMQPVKLGPEAGNVGAAEIREFLRMRLLLIFRAVREERSIFKIFFTEAQAAQARTEDLVTELNEHLVALIMTELQHLMEIGLVNPADTRVAANLIFGGLTKVCFDFLVMSETVDLEWLAGQAVEFVLLGLLGK
jgi:TetR/AcrR family fatty acid metabolism transcriptional regulator